MWMCTWTVGWIAFERFQDSAHFVLFSSTSSLFGAPGRWLKSKKDLFKQFTWTKEQTVQMFCRPFFDLEEDRETTPQPTPHWMPLLRIGLQKEVLCSASRVFAESGRAGSSNFPKVQQWLCSGGHGFGPSASSICAEALQRVRRAGALQRVIGLESYNTRMRNAVWTPWAGTVKTIQNMLKAG